MPSVLGHCWLGVRKSIRPIKTEWWGIGVVICLEQGADCLHMVQLMPLHSKTPSILASLKSRLVLPFWYRLTQVVPEKRPLNGCRSSSSMQTTYVLWRLCMYSMSVCLYQTDCHISSLWFVETAKMASKLLKFLVKSLQEYRCSWVLSESIELCRWSWLCCSLKLIILF